jgi:hypothetical protein
MRTTKFICILFMFLLLVISITGCGGGDGSTSTASVADSPASGNGSGGAVTAAGLANLAWDASPDPNVAGYKLYYGTSSGNYSNTINVGKVTSYSVSGLAPGTYYFAVSAYDASGNESSFSNEAIKTV